MIRILAHRNASRTLFVGITALVCAITCACGVSGRSGNIAVDRRATDAAIARLHQRFNARAHEEIYDDAHPLMRTMRIRAEFCDDLKEVHDTLGEVESVRDKWIKVFVGASIEIRAVYNTKFTKGDGTEMIVFRKDGDTVRLVDYRISRGTQNPTEPEWHFE